MSFTTSDFLIFFLLVCCLQRLLPHRPRNVFLLACSYFFYGCWDWRFLSLIVFSTVVDYVASHRIAATEEAPTRRKWLIISCVVNLGLLAFFKYANFGVTAANQLLAQMGIDPAFARLNILLPVGISFYTFQTMSYTIDVYRRSLKPLDSFIDFALYVAFFPQLVAGPIERGTALAPQMTRKTLATWAGIRFGVWLCLKGVFKKAVIADNMAVLVDGVFNSDDPQSGTAILLATYAFAFQIYGDFSGYSDIARGTAKLMGYDLMVNFRLPYFAQSPSEFWQRWHISLSSWLRDYLYIPLGGNRGGTLLTYRNLVLTMLLGGLWHGAAWTFLIWGAWHGVILVLQRLTGFGEAGKDDSSLAIWTRRIVMFHLVCVGWLLFRANSMSQVVLFTQSLLTNWTWNIELAQMAWQLVFLCGPFLVIQYAQETSKDLNYVLHLSLVPRTVVYATVLFLILTVGNFGGREFIYFQF
ncbi:MAG: MBOAT family protein [Planctomycetaceae bacterium]|nr:MBOAT family protein [Planctomycetaceae bacterium]MCB9952035.1 MBOAT family protein [Planctomycetaceae bacterium]